MSNRRSSNTTVGRVATFVGRRVLDAVIPGLGLGMDMHDLAHAVGAIHEISNVVGTVNEINGIRRSTVVKGRCPCCRHNVYADNERVRVDGEYYHKECYEDQSDEYQVDVVVKGRCPLCEDDVCDVHERVKLDGDYYHKECYVQNCLNGSRVDNDDEVSDDDDDDEVSDDDADPSLFRTNSRRHSHTLELAYGRRCNCDICGDSLCEEWNY
jgi:hypothetical protein